jgi:hypothetical protein
LCASCPVAFIRCSPCAHVQYNLGWFWARREVSGSRLTDNLTRHCLQSYLIFVLSKNLLAFRRYVAENRSTQTQSGHRSEIRLSLDPGGPGPAIKRYPSDGRHSHVALSSYHQQRTNPRRPCSLSPPANRILLSLASRFLTSLASDPGLGSLRDYPLQALIPV